MRVFDFLLSRGEVELPPPNRLAHESTEPNPDAARVCAVASAPDPRVMPKAMRAPVHNQAEALRALALAPQPMLTSPRTARVSRPA